MEDKKVVVLGAGSWGTALAIALANKGINVTLWARNSKTVLAMREARENQHYLPGIQIPNNITLTNDLAEAVHDKEFIVLAVPSHGIREIAAEIKEEIDAKAIIINTAKGIEPDTYLRLSQVIEEVLGPEFKDNIVILSGPTHAEEVARDIPTAIVAAAKDKAKATLVQDLFMSPKFRVYTNSDVIGVEIAGALKNVIALCTGISDGLGYGDNTKAALMTRGLTEITRLGVAMGGKPETFSGLTGIGDLIVTCTSMLSRNRRAGIEIGKGKTLDEAVASVQMVVEGIRTTKAGFGLAMKMGVEMPITERAFEVLFGGKNAGEAVGELMQRGKTTEGTAV